MSDMSQYTDTADNYARTNIKLYSLDHHRLSPQIDGYDGRQSPLGLSSLHFSRQKKCGFESIS